MLFSFRFGSVLFLTLCNRIPSATLFAGMDRKEMETIIGRMMETNSTKIMSDL